MQGSGKLDEGAMARRGIKTVQVQAVDIQGGADTKLQGALTILAGDHLGMVLAIDGRELTLGRSEESRVVLEDESLSRCHARFYREGDRYWVEDLESTNGTFVDGEPVHAPTALSDGARIQLGGGTLLRFTLRDPNELQRSRAVYEASVRDPLTSCYNRHFFDERLRAEFSYAARHDSPLTVLFIDADHFKKINDTFGHAAGDHVLSELAHLLRQSVRSEDVVARIGGEEFVILVRGIPADGIDVIAERVRADVEALEIRHEGRAIPLTVSVGVATQSTACRLSSAEELLAMADAALYRAKESGRNRVHRA